MTHFETAIDIARERAEVFAYAADPRRFAAWNSAVDSVEPLDATPAEGRRYVMRRSLPAGPATNELEILTWSPPDELVLRTVSGPTPFVYRYAFTTTGEGTRITLRADVVLGGAAALLGPLAARAVKHGVDENLATLRDLLER